jgi:hypothetical protein
LKPIVVSSVTVVSIMRRNSLKKGSSIMKRTVAFSLLRIIPFYCFDDLSRPFVNLNNILVGNESISLLKEISE